MIIEKKNLEYKSEKFFEKTAYIIMGIVFAVSIYAFYQELGWPLYEDEYYTAHIREARLSKLYLKNIDLFHFPVAKLFVFIPFWLIPINKLVVVDVVSLIYSLLYLLAAFLILKKCTNSIYALWGVTLLWSSNYFQYAFNLFEVVHLASMLSLFGLFLIVKNRYKLAVLFLLMSFLTRESSLVYYLPAFYLFYQKRQTRSFIWLLAIAASSYLLHITAIGWGGFIRFFSEKVQNVQFAAAQEEAYNYGTIVSYMNNNLWLPIFLLLALALIAGVYRRNYLSLSFSLAGTIHFAFFFLYGVNDTLYRTITMSTTLIVIGCALALSSFFKRNVYTNLFFLVFSVTNIVMAKTYWHQERVEQTQRMRKAYSFIFESIDSKCVALLDWPYFYDVFYEESPYHSKLKNYPFLEMGKQAITKEFFYIVDVKYEKSSPLGEAQVLYSGQEGKVQVVGDPACLYDSF